MKLRTANKVIRNAVDRLRPVRGSTVARAAKRMSPTIRGFHPNKSKYYFSQFAASGLRKGKKPHYVRNVFESVLRFGELEGVLLTA